MRRFLSERAWRVGNPETLIAMKLTPNKAMELATKVQVASNVLSDVVAEIAEIGAANSKSDLYAEALHTVVQAKRIRRRLLMIANVESSETPIT